MNAILYAPLSPKVAGGEMSRKWVIDEELQQIRERVEAATPGIPAPMKPGNYRGVQFWIVLYLAFIILTPCSCHVLCEWYEYTHTNDEPIRKQGLVERGMTMEQVREILGPPDLVCIDAVDQKQWHYIGFRNALTVDFDKEGHVREKNEHSRGH